MSKKNDYHITFRTHAENYEFIKKLPNRSKYMSDLVDLDRKRKKDRITQWREIKIKKAEKVKELEKLNKAEKMLEKMMTQKELDKIIDPEFDLISQEEISQISYLADLQEVNNLIEEAKV